jgi:FtsZ-interacting cell division protein ZipA
VKPLPHLDLGMHLVVLSVVAGSMLVASGIAAAAVEMIKPFEVLEETRRFSIKFDKRQKREKGEQRSRDKEQEAQRKHEEAEQRRRGREKKAQVKRDAATAKAAKSAHSPSTVLSKPPVAPALVKSALTATPQAPIQAAEPPLQVHSSPISSEVSSQPSAAPPPKPSTTEQVDEPRPQAPL